jgi:hypothetical protein
MSVTICGGDLYPDVATFIQVTLAVALLTLGFSVKAGKGDEKYPKGGKGLDHSGKPKHHEIALR